MSQVLGMALDAATLVLLTSFGLSVVGAMVTRVRRAAGVPAERMAWWQVIGPPLGGVLVVLLGFGSALWDAWMVTPDHCGDTTTHQPYLCWPHPAGAAAASPTETLAVALLVLVTGAIIARIASWIDASRRISALVALARPADATAFRAILARGGGHWRGPITVIRTDEPLCCVTGITSPRLLVSTAIAARLTPRDIAVIVAHERAHLDRRDLPRRLVAHLLSALHAPGLGNRAVAAWALRAEMACDRTAARHCGSRIAVAETLVRYRRVFAHRPASPLAGAAFAGAGELETRVRALIAARPGVTEAKRPSRALWLVLAAITLLAPGMHTGLEALLRLLHA